MEIIYYTKFTPPHDVSICKKDQLEAKRHHDNTSYIPKWKQQTSTKPILTCTYPQCTNCDNIIKASFAQVAKLREMASIFSDKECKYHYNKIYREINQPTKCASCNGYPKVEAHSPTTVQMSIGILK